MHLYKTILSILFLAVLSCNDGTEKFKPVTDYRVLINTQLDSRAADAYLLDWDRQPQPPPAPDITREERCESTPVQETQAYCQCYPQCCNTQRWYCPPNPQQTIDVMQVVVEVCDENKVPCIYGQDPQCPPPEIIAQSDCYTQWECPPGTSGEFIRWFECQLEDGTFGRQQIICDKGSLQHLPCRPCVSETCDTEDNDCDSIIDEGFFPCISSCGPGVGICIDGEVVDCTADLPSEERCNFLDDDCDGEVDEGQRNVCDDCGLVPPDICDGVDNDCDELIDEELVRECETICGRGLENCELGNWVSCTAEQPSDEACDGLDNDCDGQIDEQLNCLCTIDDVGNLMPCSEPPLLCGQGFKTCECIDPECQEMRLTDCASLCTYVQIPEPPICDPVRGIALEQEECNNFDEDCDQVIDENLMQACYTGPPDTLLVGVCIPGEAYCHRGAWGNHGVQNLHRFQPGLCLGEITPSEEICDGADNDCDGIVDYGEEIRDTDILFIVDWSGSMDQEIAAVRIALNRFATHFAAEEPLQWGLVIGPKQFPGSQDEVLVLVSDIAPFDQFLAAFAALGNEGMNTGSEMLLDAIYLAVRNISANANVDIGSTVWFRNTDSIPEKENFNITWRPDSDKIIIVFTDEEEQSYLRDAADPEGPNHPITRAIVESAARASPNLRLYSFTDLPLLGGARQNWEDITLAGRGVVFQLTSNAVSMYNDLMSIIDEACLPRANNERAANNYNNCKSFKCYSDYKLASFSKDNNFIYFSDKNSKYYDFISEYCFEKH
jgi:hypothetical protein